MWNNLKTTLLLAGLTGVLLGIGQLWGGRQGLIFALVMAAVMNFASYFFSDKLALSMSGAQPITREESPRLYQIVERLAGKANIPVPKIYFIPTDSPNAFATGRNPNHASVAVTRGILELCDDEEIEGVLAHERRRRHPGWSHHPDCAHGFLGGNVRHGRRQFGGEARRRVFSARYDDRGTARGAPDPACYFPLARI